MRARTHLVARLKTREAGFSVAPGDPDCFLWRFQLEELVDEIAPPGGTAVVLSEIMGIPFARLRAALPDAWLTSAMASALGHKSCFSLSGMNNALPLQKALTQRMRTKRVSSTGAAPASAASSPSRASNPGASRLEELVAASVADTSCDAVGKEPPLPKATHLEEMLGTALVLAYLQAACLMPVVQLAQHRSAAKRHFGSARFPNGRSFNVTCTDLVTLMSPGILDVRHKWLIRARLWKLILSQSPDGSWETCTSTAFALEARDTEETSRLKPTLLERIREALSGSAAEELEGDTGAAVEEAVEALRGDEGNVEETKAPAGNAAPEADFARDDPLTCSPAAIVRSMPARLAALQAVDPSVDVSRVWTTMCCVAHLQRLNVSWVWGDGDICACAAARLPAFAPP